jgi:hypothetical protein
MLKIRSVSVRLVCIITVHTSCTSTALDGVMYASIWTPLHIFPWVLGCIINYQLCFKLLYAYADNQLSLHWVVWPH